MNGESARGRLSPALAGAGLVLGLDAIVCQLLALTLVLPTWLGSVPDGDAGELTFTASLLLLFAVLALWCPAAAAAVLGVRTRAARLTGLATAAVVVAAGAVLAADGLGGDSGSGRFQLVAGGVVMLVNVVVVALLVTPGPGPAAAGGPGRVIELDT